MDGPAPAVSPRAFHRLGEVARLLRVAPSAVRYWQQEFHPHVHPARTRSGQNVYSNRDLAVLMRIRALLHDERLSIRDARERLRAELAANDGEPVMPDTGFQTELDLAPGPLPLPFATPATAATVPPAAVPAASAEVLVSPPSPTAADAERLARLGDALAEATAERDRLHAALAQALRDRDAMRERHHALVAELARAVRELARDAD
ncbi:MAG TPA: MerR family transcriptional regulator [Myxococcota bacterium]|jgi:DNA-binding transcriptional MerR regulator|nr:MerR family transcriptional regulator [Myxococcota bacterium]